MCVIAGSCSKPSSRLMEQPQWSQHSKNPQDFPPALVCFAWSKEISDGSQAFSISFQNIRVDEEVRFFSWEQKLIHLQSLRKMFKFYKNQFYKSYQLILQQVSLLWFTFSPQELSQQGGHVGKCECHESHKLNQGGKKGRLEPKANTQTVLTGIMVSG